MARSDERTTFLRDIITTAVEGGIGYWSQCSHYQWVDRDGTVRVPVGRRLPELLAKGAFAVVYAEGGEDPLTIDVETVARGLKLICEGGCDLNDRIRNAIRVANHESDAGMLDADDADVIVQAGLLGEIVYG